MSFATETNIKVIEEAGEKFPVTMSDWTLNKVHYDEATNAIRARFKNESVAMISGIVKPGFCVKTTMEFSEIMENVTLDRIVFKESFTAIAEKILNIEIE